MHDGNGALYERHGEANQLVGNGDLPDSPVEITETGYPVRVGRLELAPKLPESAASVEG